MKKLIKNYDFYPATNEISFNDYSIIYLERVLLITNVTTNEIIYNFADHLLGGTMSSSNILMLNKDCSSYSSEDDLQIFYEDDEQFATEQTLQLLLNMAQNTDNSVQLLKRMLKILEPISTQDSSQRQRVAVETIANMSTLSTVSTVSNLNAVAGVDYRWLIIDQARNAYANGIRNNIQ